MLCTRSPVYSPCGFLPRLACVRHAASVRSEPGSNSPIVFYWSYPALINSPHHPAKGRCVPLKVIAGTTIHLRLVSSCSPVFKDPNPRTAHFQRQSRRRCKIRPYFTPTARLASCRCARFASAGGGVYRFAFSTSSFFFQPSHFFLPTSFPRRHFSARGAASTSTLFRRQVPSESFFNRHFRCVFPTAFPCRLQRGGRGVLPSPPCVKTLRDLFFAPSRNSVNGN